MKRSAVKTKHGADFYFETIMTSKGSDQSVAEECLDDAHTLGNDVLSSRLSHFKGYVNIAHPINNSKNMCHFFQKY
jgi:hypothetical protein